jgi:ammonium transporter, Amt family
VTPDPFPALTLTVCIFSILLVPLAAAGLMLINAGLSRSRNAAHMMLASLCVIAIAALVYFVCGFGFEGFVGHGGYAALVAGKRWDWIAAEPWFFRGLRMNGSPAGLSAWLGMLSAGLAALIPLGAGGGRWRLRSIWVSTALLAGWTYPLFAHWVWGGWLSQLGLNFGLGRGFVDAGGAGAIHAVGGLTALSIAWLLGPRRGKFSAVGAPMAIPGHDFAFVLFGCLLALTGWLGLNSAGSILLAGVLLPEMVVASCINTLLAAGAGFLSVVLLTRARYGKPDVSLSANGWVAGLVASSAGCGLIAPAAAIIIGAAAGGLAIWSVELLEVKLGVDDPSGAISVHAVGGIWGLLTIGCFDRLPGSTGSGQWLAQLVGVATLVGFVLPLTYGLNWLLNRISPQKVAQDGERHGMDLHELGASAYPELASHIEDFSPW